MKWFKSYRVIYISAGHIFWVVNSRFKLQYRIKPGDNAGIPSDALAEAKRIAEKRNIQGFNF